MKRCPKCGERWIKRLGNCYRCGYRPYVWWELLIIGIGGLCVIINLSLLYSIINVSWLVNKYKSYAEALTYSTIRKVDTKKIYPTPTIQVITQEITKTFKLTTVTSTPSPIHVVDLKGDTVCADSGSAPLYDKPNGRQIGKLSECAKIISSYPIGPYYATNRGWVNKHDITLGSKTLESSEPKNQPVVPKNQPVNCDGGCTNHPIGCDIKGNISLNTGERIYHIPGGEFYSSTQVRPEYGEKWFCTEGEAIAAGWRRSYR